MKNRFNKEFFIQNRKSLSEALPGHVLFIPAHALLQYSADLHYPFRQDSNFWYLCGVNEPDAVLIIDTDTYKTTLLLPKKNKYQSEWDGVRSTKELQEMSGVDEIRFKSALNPLLKSAMQNSKKIGYIAPSKNRIEPYGFYANPARQLLAQKLSRIIGKENLYDIRLEIARLRQVKQPVEVEAIKAAIEATAQTLEIVKVNLSSYKNEKDIERAITAGFYDHGADGHAYEPIIAGGKNAAIIHYVSNDSALCPQDMLLLDVGARVDGYAADISRTWMLGTASERQKAIFAACLDIQKTGISMLKPGVLLRDVQDNLSEYAKKIFKKLDCSMKNKPFPHGFSHFLGLDVHDSGDYTKPLEPGMVLTMEPGIYLADEDIGVRIEDDILITENGAENLSDMIPKLL